MVAFPSTTATQQHPATPGELITVHGRPPCHYRYTGVFLDVVRTCGRLWLEIQEQPGKPPLALAMEGIQRIERHETLIAPRVGAA